MEFLKEIYGQDALTYEQFCEKVNAHENIKIGNIADGSYVDRKSYDDVSEQLKQANKKYADYDPDWKTKVADAQAESEKKLNEYKFDVAVSKAIISADVADEISVKANIDTSKVKLDENGNLTGLEEQLSKLKESKPFLFKAEQKPKLNLGGPTPGIGHRNMNGLKGAIEEHYKN